MKATPALAATSSNHGSVRLSGEADFFSSNAELRGDLEHPQEQQTNHRATSQAWNEVRDVLFTKHEQLVRPARKMGPPVACSLSIQPPDFTSEELNPRQRSSKTGSSGLLGERRRRICITD